mgnify:CR=1 FL=1
MRSRIFTNGRLASLLLVCTQLSWAQDAELDALLLESSNLMQESRIEEALVLLAGAENTYGDSREFMNNLAVAYLGNSQPEKALTIFRSLVDQDPLYSIIAHNLLEMELQIPESRSEQINPVLFVQSVDSYFAETPAEVPAEVPAEAPSEIPADQPVSSTVREDVQKQVEMWASHWSDKNIIGYLSMYSRNFIGPQGENMNQWARARRAPLSKPGPISVLVNNFDTRIINNDVQVSFDQNYSSSNYSDRVRKQLVFTNEAEGWKIIREVTLETY